jgi:hypothetical protein
VVFIPSVTGLLFPSAKVGGQIAVAALIEAQIQAQIGTVVLVQRYPVDAVTVLAAATLPGTEASVSDLVLEIHEKPPTFVGGVPQCGTMGNRVKTLTSSFTTNAGSVGSYSGKAAVTLYSDALSVIGKGVGLRSPRTGDLACGILQEL